MGRRRTRSVFAWLLTLLSVPASAACSPQAASAPASAPAASQQPSTQPGHTVFSAGIHPPSGAADPGTAFDVKVLRELGVTYTRTQVSTMDQSGQPVSSSYRALTSAGFKVLLNVYNKGSSSSRITNKAGKSKPVASPPTDLAAYTKEVSTLVRSYRPALVVVENEENGRYYHGTPAQYLAELQAATTVAHQLGYRVADGGMTGVPLSLAVWKDYWDRGLKTQADDFAKRAFAPGTKAAAIYGELPTSAQPDKPFPPGDASLKATYAWTVAGLQALKGSSIDYVNFHWYQEDAKAFGEVADYLQRVTGKPVISNEVGSSSPSPAIVSAVLQQAVDRHMAYVNWFSGDVVQENNGAYSVLALQNPDGTLRQTGQAFAAFVHAH